MGHHEFVSGVSKLHGNAAIFAKTKFLTNDDRIILWRLYTFGTRRGFWDTVEARIWCSNTTDGREIGLGAQEFEHRGDRDVGRNVVGRACISIAVRGPMRLTLERWAIYFRFRTLCSRPDVLEEKHEHKNKIKCWEKYNNTEIRYIRTDSTRSRNPELRPLS